MATETAAPAAQTRTPAKLKIGKVVSDKRNKTITVEVRRPVKHQRYGKYLYRSTLFHAHDEKNEANAGDTVEIRACRPLSKQKRWSIVRIVDRADSVDVQVKDVEVPQAKQKQPSAKKETEAKTESSEAKAGEEEKA